MNTPIINPWAIYMFDVIPHLGDTLVMVIVFALLGLFAYCLYTTLEIATSCYSDEKEEAITKKMMKIIKTTLCCVVIMTTINVFIPSKETLLTMYAVNFITPQNVEMVGDGIENTIDYIVDKIEEVVDTEEAE